jgi:hypothetical protein
LLSRRQAAGTDGYIAYLTTAVQNTVMGFNNSGSTNAQGVLNNHSYFGNLNAFGLQFTTSGIVALTIATSGAATFNNNVSVAGTLNVTGTSTLTGRVFGIEIGVSKNGSDTVADGPWYRWTNADASRQILTQLNAGNGLTTWSFNGSSWSSIYTLTSTGAATFSSSVQTGGDILVRGSYNPYSATNRGNITLNGTSSNILGFANNTTTRGYILHDGTDIEIANQSSGVIHFFTSSGEAMRINSGLSILTYSSLSVGGSLDAFDLKTLAPTGNSNPTWRLGAAATGTVNANRLIRVEIAGVGYDLVARQII